MARPLLNGRPLIGARVVDRADISRGPAMLVSWHKNGRATVRMPDGTRAIFRDPAYVFLKWSREQQRLADLARANGVSCARARKWKTNGQPAA